MASRSRGSLLLVLVGFIVIFLASIVRSSKSVMTPSLSGSLYDTSFLNRSSFPSGFIFGTASASYQVIK